MKTKQIISLVILLLAIAGAVLGHIYGFDIGAILSEANEIQDGLEGLTDDITDAEGSPI